MGYDRRAPQLGKSFFFDHLWSTSIGAQILSLTIIRKTTTQNHYAVLGLNLHHSNSNNTVSVCFQLHLYWQSLKAVVLHHWAPKKTARTIALPKRRKPTPSINHLNHWISTCSIYFNLQEGNHFDLPIGDSFSHSHLWWWSYQRQLLKGCGKKSSKLFRN